MTHAVTIDQAGRIVLPTAVRRRLNLGPGSRLMLDVAAQRIDLTPQPDASADTDTDDGLLAVPGRRLVMRPTGQAFDAAASIRAERDARAEGAVERATPRATPSATSRRR